MDLLEREGLETALLGLRGVPLHGLHRPVEDRLAGLGDEELDAAGSHGDDLAVLDQLDVARVGEEGGDRRAHELLAVAAPDDERALLASGDQEVGLLDADRDERIVTAKAVVGPTDRLDEATTAVELARDEVGDDLRIGLRCEDGAIGDELLLELQVVLDDAVDDDVDAVVVVEVRVGVLLRDPAVRGPAGVPDARRRRPRGDGDGPFAALGGCHGAAQAAEVADRAHGLQLGAREHGDAGGVISAVLQLLQPLEQDGLDGPAADISDDSAHGRLLKARTGHAGPATG